MAADNGSMPIAAGLVGLLLWAAALAPAATAQDSGCTTGIVASKAGPVCGALVSTATGKQARAFLGIPYAESTAGEKRWTSPVKKRPWRETFPAVRHGPACPQTVLKPAAHTIKHTDKHSDPQQLGQGEDCLSLNIWTPVDAGSGATLPVLAFIHGGAFEAGSSADPLYDGAHLAANWGVILVSFNYRLGVLGFLAADGLSGNYGFLDQQLALSWVHENISAFGGDPRKVTLFGESAGAMSVGLHLFSAPASARLFRAAIMESNFFALPYKRLEDQANVGNIFKQGLNCPDTDCLRKRAIDELIAAQLDFTDHMSTVFSGAKFYIPFSPAIDGTVLTRQPMHGAADGTARKPILMGTNKNEAVLFVGGRDVSPMEYSAWVASLFGKDFQKVIVRFPERPGPGNGATWARAQTENFLLCSTRHVAVTSKAPVHVYLFNHQPSFNVWGGADCRKDGNVCHGDELPFVFHSADKIGGKFTPEEMRLSNAMMEHWANFAATLDPNGRSSTAASPHWPRFGAHKSYLALNIPALAVQADPFRDACKFWDSIGYVLTEPWAPKRR
jgi:carboxylesterase type B